MRWTTIAGFENYMVSDSGLIKNSKGNILKPYDNGHGYKKVKLYKNGTPHRLYVHRLVGFAYVNGYESGLTIDHLDGNKENNSWDNLEWTTLEENVKRMHLNKTLRGE